ncbi:hypothetical protein M011DRAFT_370434, partial [Sporormia fimetaria CBS 119925]
MPPRIRLRPRALHLRVSAPHSPLTHTYASLATATTPAPAIHTSPESVSIRRYPPTQPPSHKPPETRKSQLHRQYQSLLRSSPLILLFQHNNILAVEWMSLRRELAAALQKVDAELAGSQEPIADEIKLQVIQTGIFASALDIVEYYDPVKPTLEGEDMVHGLSSRAYEIAQKRKRKLKSGLEPLLSGPLAVVAFPTVSPQHLKAVLSTISPSKEFPAPKRKANPEYHSLEVQGGLAKLMLLGARVEGKVFDYEGTKWIGGIEGGLGGLRAQLVAMLQGVGASLTGALEGASRSLYMTVESRRMDMEEKEKG